MTRRRIDDFIGATGPKERVGTKPAGQSGLCRREDMERIEDALEEIVNRLEKLEEELRRLRIVVERSLAVSSAAQRPARATGRRGRSRLVEVLRESRYILASEARAVLGMSPQRLRSEAAAQGLVVVDAGGDFAVMTRDAFEEFKAILSAVASPDPGEASREVGDYRRLFEALRAGGQVYYDARRRRWRLLED